MTRVYHKPALTIEQQIAHLRANGMIVDDDDVAVFWLRHVSYYRLSAYWLSFEHPKGVPGPRFRAGTRFSDIAALYDFDRELRRITMRGAEHVEVALRGSWAYQLAHSGGGHGYLNPALYANEEEFHRNETRLKAEVRASSETYVRHYRESYDEPTLPPVWMVAEMMSFGQISRWYSNLADRSLRNRIAQPLGLTETVLVSLVRHVTDIRNTCAHHGRLWNRGYLQPPRLASKPRDLNQSLDLESAQAPAKLYNGLTMIAHVVRTVAPKSLWTVDIADLVEKHPAGDLAAMGFPADWRTRPLWI